MFTEEVNVDKAVSFFYQNRIYISDIFDEEGVSEEVKKAAEYFLENDVDYDGDEAEAWKRFLNSNS